MRKNILKNKRMHKKMENLKRSVEIGLNLGVLAAAFLLASVGMCATVILIVFCLVGIF